MRKYIALCLSTIILLGCPGPNVPPVPDPDPVPELWKDTAWIISNNNTFELIGIHQNGSLVAIDTTAESFYSYQIIYKEKDSPELFLWLKEDGRPTLGHVDGNFIVFENYDSDSVDLGFVWSTGAVEIVRNIPVQNLMSSAVSAFNINFPTSLLSASGLGDFLHIAGLGLSIGACAISAGAALASGGFLIPIAVIGCGSTLVRVIMEATNSDNAAIEGSSSALEFVAGAAGCIGGGDCVSFFVSTAGSILEVASNRYEQNATIIDTTRGALQQTGGDVQVTLTWDNSSDLDIWVTDPFGERIYWAHPYSVSGGRLDRDDIDGYGPENIYWPTGGAPLGNYIVDLDYYSGYGTATYSVLIQAFGQSRQYSGTIQPYQTLRISTFSDHGFSTATRILIVDPTPGVIKK